MDSRYISVCKKAAEILSNSIVVNELGAREGTTGAYVLLGLAETHDSYIIVRSIINKKTWNLEQYEELYAIRKEGIKKEDVGFKPPHYIQTNGYGTSSVISIADFLNIVKRANLANEVFSVDVANRLSMQRSHGVLSQKIQFSGEALNEKQISELQKRGIKGDALLNAIDLSEEILSVNGDITEEYKKKNCS